MVDYGLLKPQKVKLGKGGLPCKVPALVEFIISR
jgi:hypothetical protein